jgi:hypothetical protein
MANYLPGYDEPQMQDISRQRKMAEFLRNQSMDPAQGAMVSGHYVAPSITQNLAKLLQGYQANKLEKGADTKAQAYADMLKGKKEEWVASMPKASTEQNFPADGMGPPQAIQKQPTPEDYMLWSMAAPDPQLGQISFNMANEGIAREDRNAQSEAQRAQRMQEIEMRLQDARLAREDRAALSREMATLAASNRQPVAPVVTEVLRDGKVVKIDARTGTVIGDAPRAGQGKPMSSVAQKELLEADEGLQGSQSALSLLKQAKDINDKAMGFTGAGAVASMGTLLPESIRPEAVDATQNLDNILQSQSLPQLKAIFGGMPTEGERKILLDVQGSSSKPPKVRAEIFKRAETAIQNRMNFLKDKAAKLRNGSYFGEDGAPAGTAAPTSDIDSLLDKYK